MSKSAREDEMERHALSLRLDQELEDTFPASDALKITRTTTEQARKPEAAGTKREPTRTR